MFPEGLSEPHANNYEVGEIALHGAFEGERIPEDTPDALPNPYEEDHPIAPESVRRHHIIARARAQIERVEAEGHPYLLPHQLSGYLACLRHISTANPHSTESHAGRFIEPTGYGKSAVIVALTRDLSARSLVVTSRHHLVDQFAQESIPTFGPELVSGELSGRAQPPSTIQTDIDLTNYYFLTKADPDAAPDPKAYDLVFLDEGHNTLGKVISKKLAPYEQESLATIVTTATESYGPGRHLHSRYPELIEKKTIVDGIEEGFLSGIQIFAARTGKKFIDKGYLARHGYTYDELEPLIDDPERTKMVLDIAVHGLEHAGDTGLIRCIRGDGQRHARDIACALRSLKHPRFDRTIRAEAIGDHRDSGDFRERSADIIQKLKRGEIDIITTTEMATQGIDFKTLAWGADVGPRRSLLGLEQFMGRGMRAKDKPFVFYQLLDEPENFPERLAYCWDVLGIKEPQQGMALLRNGERQQVISPDTLPPSLRPFPEREQAQQLPAVGTHEIKEALNPGASAENSVSLTQLVNQTGIARHILKRILFDNAYTFTVKKDEQGEHEEQYPQEAEILLDYLVSQPDNQTVANTARKLGIRVVKLEYILDKEGIRPFEQYPRGAQKRARFERHLNSSQRIAVQEALKTTRDLLPMEITLSEMAKLAGNFNFRSRDYFEQRGFRSVPVTTLQGKTVYAFDRDQMTEYIDSYVNAEPLPNKHDYVNVKDIVNIHPDARLHHVFAAASIARVPVQYFLVNARTRAEFISAKDQDTVEALLPKVVAYYETQHAAAKAVNPSHNKRKTTLPHPEAIETILPDRHPLEEVLAAFPVQVPDGRAVLEKSGLVAEDGTIAHQNRARAISLLREALVSTEVKVNRAPHEQSPKTVGTEHKTNTPPEKHTRAWQPYYLRNLAPVTYRDTLPLAKLNLSQHQHINTLVALTVFHPHFRGAAIVGLDDKNRVVADRDTYIGLFAMLRDKATPTIPPTWIPAQQICRDMNIDEASYVSWLKDSGYTQENLITISWRGHDVQFCSPRLARASVDIYRRHAEQLHATAKYGIDPDEDATYETENS